jgi:hypothetical protein
VVIVRWSSQEFGESIGSCETGVNDTLSIKHVDNHAGGWCHGSFFRIIGMIVVLLGRLITPSEDGDFDD